MSFIKYKALYSLAITFHCLLLLILQPEKVLGNSFLSRFMLDRIQLLVYEASTGVQLLDLTFVD